MWVDMVRGKGSEDADGVFVRAQTAFNGDETSWIWKSECCFDWGSSMAKCAIRTRIDGPREISRKKHVWSQYSRGFEPR